MDTEKKGYGKFVVIGILLALFVPIIVDYISKQKIEELSYDAFKEKIELKETFVIYNGKVEGKEKSQLLSLKNKSDETTEIEYSLYSINTKELDKKVYIYIEGDLQQSYDKFDYDKINIDVDTFVFGKNIDENKSYKVVDNFNAFKKLVNSDTLTMSVFGRNSCSWCNKYKPIYNALAAKYNIDIYYFDSDSFNETEYKKIINMNLVVPAKCNNKGTDFKLSDGFGTPLTLFTKNGKVVDCISGYKNREALIEKLRSVNMISE